MKKYIIQILLTVVSIAFAQSDSMTQEEWNNLPPPTDQRYDWLQLTSGEWLKGDFKALYEYELDFDSDEMNLLTIDFEDVRQLRTRNPQTVQIDLSSIGDPAVKVQPERHRKIKPIALHFSNRRIGFKRIHFHIPVRGSPRIKPEQSE